MIENDCGCIPVVESWESMKPVGTITDRDIAVRAFGAGKDPQYLTASDIMTSDIICVTPDMNIDECCDVMENNQIRRVLVADKENRCCGIVAQADVARHASAGQTAEVVQEISDADSVTGKKGRRAHANDKSIFSGESILTLLAGVGSGAAAMYFLDPDRGQRRRALVGDQITSIKNDAEKAVKSKKKQLQKQATGVLADAKKAVTGKQAAADIR
jgi:hypothetical protein